jgi:hypothetical protein
MVFKDDAMTANFRLITNEKVAGQVLSDLLDDGIITA